jgi:hypothetical protein
MRDTDLAHRRNRRVEFVVRTDSGPAETTDEVTP